VHQIDDPVDAVSVLIVFDPERNRKKPAPAEAGNLSPAAINPAMFGQFAVVPAVNEILQVSIKQRTRWHAGQQLSEPEIVFRRVNLQFHLMPNQPDKAEVPAAGFAEPAKNAPVSVSLQTLSDYAQWPGGRLSAGNRHSFGKSPVPKCGFRIHFLPEPH
jgi:hypothetical protein